MKQRKRIVLTVTSYLNYDQRMIRICSSLHNAGYEVTIIGRRKPGQPALTERPYQQEEVMQRLNQGKMFFALYNIKMFFRLLFKKMDAVCAIDLDTILPVYYISRLRGIPRVYDAHEIFSEMEEVVTRPVTHKMWLWIERHTVPYFRLGYTVNKSYVDEFRKRYGVHYRIVRNATVLKPLDIADREEKFILYQGAVNKGRCFEQLIPAMKYVHSKLVVCGEGNFLEEARALTKEYGLEGKVIFEGYVPPKELEQYTRKATVGITLFVATSLSNELSLANRFFDYMHHAVPQLGVSYPEYMNINKEFEVACLLDTVTPDTVAEALNKLLTDSSYYERLKQNCLKAREVYCWQEEEKRLLKVYEEVFGTNGNIEGK